VANYLPENKNNYFK